MTLRDVEHKTGGVENGTIRRPSPGVLWELSNVYGLDYAELLVLAGHRVPEPRRRIRQRELGGIPLDAFKDLDDNDRRDLLAYLAFLKDRKKKRR
jgi:hypothetical protein